MLKIARLLPKINPKILKIPTRNVNDGFPISFNFKLTNGEVKQVWATPGENLLDVAIDNGVDEAQNGFFGICGGGVCCSTCHVILEENVYDSLDPATDDEDDLLDYVKALTQTSRLACCLNVNVEMNETTITLPEEVVDLRD